MHTYKILYRDPNFPSRGQQTMVIQADSSHNAARQFQAMYPQFKLSTQPTKA